MQKNLNRKEQEDSCQVFFPTVDSTEIKAIDSQRLLPTGNERILFVDDEPALARIGDQVLRRLGYKVVSTTSSLEALKLFRTQPDRFDLVITDMTMPDMTGDKLAAELMRIRSDIPVILCTGYSEQITEKKARKMGIRDFKMKPVALHDIATTVRNVLDEK